MKKLSLALAFALAAAGAQAESVTITHETAGGLADELAACGTEMANITELTITGDAVMNATDFAAIRSNLRPSLTMLDLSQAKFTNNKLPGGDYDKQGILQTMNVVEVKLPETLTGLSGGVFFKCRKLEKVNLPDGIKSINQYCFSGCSKLKLEKLPPYLTSIAADGFRGCSSLELTELPETIKTIGGDAFNEDEENGYKNPAPGIAFTKLPSSLTSLGNRAFRRTGCTFSEWPVGLTSIPESAFAATSVTFKELSPYIESIASYAFQSVKTMTEFTIPDQAGLWAKIPDACFFVQSDDVKRTFICRAPSAPKATVNIGSGAWTGSFSQVAKNPNTTFKVLASALQSYQEKAPYNTMNLEILTTAIAEPVIDKPIELLDEHFTLSFAVNGEEYTDYAAIPEGPVTLKIAFNDGADDNIYVDEVAYAEPDAYADEDVEEPEAPSYLYKADDPTAMLKQAVEVPVTVTPDMPALSIKLTKYSDTTGIDNIAADNADFVRRGDVLYLTNGNGALYNIAGALVATATANTIDMAGLADGIYILRSGKTAAKIVK